MSDRVLGKMSEYMSKYMSWNAMVEITRSKVIFWFSFLSFFLPSFLFSLSLSAANLGAAHAKVRRRQTEVNAVFIQQTMRVAQADQELIIKQRISCLTAVVVSDLRAYIIVPNGGFLKWVVPRNGWFKTEHPFKNDDFRDLQIGNSNQKED